MCILFIVLMFMSEIHLVAVISFVQLDYFSKKGTCFCKGRYLVNSELEFCLYKSPMIFFLSKLANHKQKNFSPVSPAPN